MFGQVAQPSPQTLRYSESRTYTPRPTEKRKKDDKKSNEKKASENDSATGIVAEKVPSSIQAVTVRVSVFDQRGALVRDLRPDDFKVYLNDIEAELSSVTAASAQQNIILLIDTSPSIATTIKDNEKLVTSLLRDFDPKWNIMVVQFDSKLKIVTGYTTDRDLILRSIKPLKNMGTGTSIYDAMAELAVKADAEFPGRAAVVLLTDGVDTTSRRTGFSASLLAAENSDLVFFPYYIDTFSTFKTPAGVVASDPRMQSIVDQLVMSGRLQLPPRASMEKEYEVGKLYLNDLAQLSGGRAVSPAPSNKVALPSLGEELKNEYLVNVELPANTVAGERIAVRVRVNRPNLAVLARGSLFLSN